MVVVEGDWCLWGEGEGGGGRVGGWEGLGRVTLQGGSWPAGAVAPAHIDLDEECV